MQDWFSLTHFACTFSRGACFCLAPASLCLPRRPWIREAHPAGGCVVIHCVRACVRRQWDGGSRPPPVMSSLLASGLWSLYLRVGNSIFNLISHSLRIFGFRSRILGKSQMFVLFSWFFFSFSSCFLISVRLLILLRFTQFSLTSQFCQWLNF